MNNSRISTETVAPPKRVKVVVATTVMLSFISFWRAAAIVLNDLGSSAYYVGGIAEQAVGKAAPWFVLGVMLFSYAVRSVYVESCVMFTRGGVYRVVKESMGGTLAKLSVSALMFDYILTGPISGVSAGQYIVGLVAQTVTYFGHPWSPSAEETNYLAAGIAILVTIYFWWRNTMGIHESSGDALRIMYVTTAMVVMLIVWAGYSIISQPDKQRLPPSPTPHNLAFNRDAVGWLPDIAPSVLREIPAEASEPAAKGETPQESEPRLGLVPTAGAFLGLIGILMAFGHSFLAMSGEESLAQVNRELEYPKHKNLMRAGFVIFVYSLLFTSLVSFFAYALIPDDVRISTYRDNLISGIAMYLAGPLPLKLLFQAFIVIVGCLMLSGAINTSIIGSNGVLNRVSEDGVMTDWFRAPHKKFGTTYRMINLIVILQLMAIIFSRGNTYLLGEAYAFGVIWSFSFNSLSMLVLRFRDKSQREWKVPINVKIADKEIPLGLGIIAVLLFSVAGINLITKEVATIAGVAFTVVFFIVFTVSEHINQRKLDKSAAALDQFTLNYQPDVSIETIGARPGSVLVSVRDYNTLFHLGHVLERTNTEEQDIVVMTARLLTGPDAGERDLYDANLFTDYEQRLFTRVVALAEKQGKPVELVVVPAANIFDAVAQTAFRLDAAVVVAGLSSKMTAQEQARELGRAWERLPEKPRRQVWLKIVSPDNQEYTVFLGAHAPDFTDDDLRIIHNIWLKVSQIPARKRVRHRDVVRVALERLERDLQGQSDVMLDFYKLEHKDQERTRDDHGKTSRAGGNSPSQPK
jgi:amino acid transporter